VIHLVGDTLPASVVPVLVFLLVGFCVFSSGSCWIIMLITIPIFLPLAAATGASTILTLAALMSGVGAGYTLCFYADAVFMTTASTGVANLTITKTVMPYGAAMTVLSAGFYLAMGFLM
jgi:Na+/H+ antiporter NhaC